MKVVKLLSIVALVLFLGGCDKGVESPEVTPDDNEEVGLETLEYAGEVDGQLFVYGEFLHFDFDFGSLSFDEASLVIGETKLLITEGVNGYTVSDILNEGYFLPDLSIGQHYFHVELKTGQDVSIYSIKDDYDFVFYPIKRNDEYKEISLEDNVFTVSLIDELPTDVYDVVIDVGHGGVDGGANATHDGVLYLEKDEVLDFSIKLEEQLKAAGLKVKLTRYEDEYPGGVSDFFADGGRVEQCFKASPKLVYSIHLNAHPQDRTGFEIYATSRGGVIAQHLVNNLSEVSVSSNSLYHKASDGIYTRYLSQEDISSWQESLATRKESERYEMFEILLTSNRKVDYYAMVRELGALATDAYEDGRRPDRESNEDRESIYGIEAVLVELAFIDDEEDFLRFKDNNDGFVQAVTKSIIDYLNN